MGSSCSKSRSVDVVQGQRPVRRVSGTNGGKVAPTGIQGQRLRNNDGRASLKGDLKTTEANDQHNAQVKVEAAVTENSKDGESQNKEATNMEQVPTKNEETSLNNEVFKDPAVELQGRRIKQNDTDLQESCGEESGKDQREAAIHDDAKDQAAPNKETTDVTDVTEESTESTKKDQNRQNNDSLKDPIAEVQETSNQQGDQVQVKVATHEISTDHPVQFKENAEVTIVKKKAPERRTKKDLIPDVDVFKELDERAVQAPEGHTTTQDLVSYLIEPAKTPLEKARVLFRWVTSHVKYDVVSYATGGSTDNSPEGVFKNRMSVCQGYADLYKEMCRCAEVNCVTISGRSKGGPYRVGQKFGPGSDHAWNAVEVDGDWYLLDCTWAAGNTDIQKKTFEFAYNEHYFFTDPEVFVMDHHPMDNKWQLLEEPVSLHIFENQVFLRPPFFKLGLKPKFLSHITSPVCTQNGEATISIKIPEPMAFSYHLYPSEGGYDQKENILHEIVDGVVMFKVAPAEKGELLLKIYGRYGASSGSYDEICSYIVDSVDPSPDHVPFPRLKTSTWGPGPWLLDGFLTDVSHPNAIVTLPEGEAKITFSAFKPLQYKCQINDDKYYRDEYAFFQVNDREVGVYVRAPETGQFTLTIWAKEENDQKFNKCIYYLLKCNKCKASVSPFPKTFNNWTNGCQLYEPLDGRLAANRRVHFRVTCPNAVEVVVIAGQWHKLTKSADGSWEGEADTGQPDSILKVSTKMLGDTQYWTLLQYEVVG